MIKTPRQKRSTAGKVQPAPALEPQALGILETRGTVAAVAAADAMLKAAAVHLASLRQAGGGLVAVFITGDVSAVKEAIDCGAAAANRFDSLMGQHVIARPDASVAVLLTGRGASALPR